MILNAVKLPSFNASAEKATETPPLPGQVIIDMSQNMGAVCEPLVKTGDYVCVGQVIGESTALLSVPVHASVSGTVTDEVELIGVSGKSSRAIVIESDRLNTQCETLTPPEVKDRASLLKAVRASGSVGLGGAGFPTHTKLAFDQAKTPVKVLIINAAECEPYLTSDYREIMENAQGLLDGIDLLMEHLNIPSAIIGIEKDKPKAIKLLENLLRSTPDITVKPLPRKYPQGAEKILVYQTTGLKIKAGDLPLHAGCLVMNVSTVSFISDYVRTGVPLIRRRVTLDGDVVDNARNVFVPVGTPLDELIKIAGLPKSPDRIVFGGPMMGTTVYDMKTPVTKTTGAVLFFGDTKRVKEGPCIRCGKCIHVCSMNLTPYDLNLAFDKGNSALLKKLCINLCMACASCTFICPARRNVCEKNQMAKAMIRQESGK